jgi:hypothetical protein
MKPLLKKILIGVGAVVGLVAAGGGIFVWVHTSAFDSSMAKVYDVPLSEITLSTDPAVLARGEHLARSVSGCAMADCHGADRSGGKLMEMGPLGKFQAPNITAGGMGAVYSDAELARLVRHGIKKDGRSVIFMPVHETNWVPQDDLVAVVSLVRSVPAVEKPNGPVSLGTLAKILDRRDSLVLDVARRIDHDNIDLAPPAAPTAAYGKHIGKLCSGCHGTTYSGGKIPGAPPDIPIPTNITPHETGIKDWSYADFTRLLDEGIKKNGEKLNPFMPLEALTNMDETERKALYAFLMSLPPREFGNR